MLFVKFSGAIAQPVKNRGDIAELSRSNFGKRIYRGYRFAAAGGFDDARDQP